MKRPGRVLRIISQAAWPRRARSQRPESAGGSVLTWLEIMRMRLR